MRPPHYILAGGRSRRFGQDKARADYHGRTLLQAVAQGFAGCVQDTWAVAGEEGDYDDLGVCTIADRHPGLGPLAGLETALTHRGANHGEGWALVSSCDLTDPSSRWLTPLFDTLSQAQPDSWAIVYRADDRWDPFPGLFHTRGMSAVRRALSEPPRSMQKLLAGEGVLPAPCPPGATRVPQANTPEQLAGAQA
ncbi:MAG: molybdenum cofactor guanylyltransferase [Planctomycetota bacterium]